MHRRGRGRERAGQAQANRAAPRRVRRSARRHQVPDRVRRQDSRGGHGRHRTAALRVPEGALGGCQGAHQPWGEPEGAQLQGRERAPLRGVERQPEIGRDAAS